MCGISAIISSNCNVEEITKKMILTLRHRGPDDLAMWIDPLKKVGIGHTRLSILDLTKSGKQPMFSDSTRYLISYNGEIYNQTYLKNKLNINKSIKWIGTSDTEVLINYIEIFGLENALNEIDGMYAFVIFDLKLNKLYVVRDKFGEKPIYYYHSDQTFAVASEIKSLLLIKNKNFTLDEKAISHFYENGYIPAPFTIYKDIKKLEQGHYLTINLDNQNKIKLHKKKYSFLNENRFINKNYIEEIKLNKDFFNEIENTICQSIIDKTSSDKPLGCFLSSGKDSSLIASILQKNLNNKIDTFTLGLEQAEYDESVNSEKISKQINTNFHKIIFPSNQIELIFDSLIDIFDEPFGDSSAVLMYYLSKEAKKDVSVCLTGDGSDEIFGGYNRYYKFLKIKKLHNQKFLKSIINLAECIVYKFPAILNNKFIFKYFERNLYQSLKSLKKYLNEKNVYKLYDLLCKFNYDFFEQENNLRDLKINLYSNLDVDEYMLFIDFQKYLADDILVKSDRTSMANGLELRLPFLNDKLIKDISFISPKTLFNKFPNKKIIDNILQKYLPISFFNKKPKRGFTAPVDYWLRNELKKKANQLLQTKSLNQVDEKAIVNARKLFKLHLDGRGNYGNIIWNCLVFQLFKKKRVF